MNTAMGTLLGGIMEITEVSAFSSCSAKGVIPPEKPYEVDSEAARNVATTVCQENYNPTLCDGEPVFESLVQEVRNISTAAVDVSYKACVANEGDIEAARNAVTEQCSALTGIGSTAYMFGIDAFFSAASAQCEDT